MVETLRAELTRPIGPRWLIPAVGFAADEADDDSARVRRVRACGTPLAGTG
jgi:hypothetical protein